MIGKNQQDGRETRPPEPGANGTATAADPGREIPNPLVSIIVPTRNRGPFLERCLESILHQSYRNLECLVMDGASNDDSVSILERLSRQDPRLRFRSEPDRGEVEATNKGLHLARGDIVGIQASDDFYTPDAVESAVDFLCRHPKYIGVAGDAWFVDPQGTPLGRGMITYRGRMNRQTLRRLLIVRYKTSFLNHGTFLGWRQRLQQHGAFNPEFSVTPDLEFYTRVLAAGEEIGCLPRVQVHYTIHPEMGAVQHWRKVDEQLRRIHDRHGLRWHHHLLRLTVGRGISYLSNPLRTPLVPGLRREMREWWRRRVASRRPG
jgi:glycosyltransferase involved in cell wall biosynthesis